MAKRSPVLPDRLFTSLARSIRRRGIACGPQMADRMRSRFFEGSPSVAGLSVADQRALLKLLRRAIDLGTANGRRDRESKP